MARKRDPNIQRKREEAQEMEAQGLTSAEIAKAIGGVAPATVRHWLTQIRGPKKATKASQIEKLGRAGVKPSRIIEITGASKATVYTALKKVRPSRQLVRSAERADLFLQDPNFTARYIREESFPVEIMRSVTRRCEANARQGLRAAEIAAKLFRYQLDRARSLKRKRRCNLVHRP